MPAVNLGSDMFKFILLFAASVGALVILFIVWRFTSVARGMRQRDEAVLARLLPVAEKIGKGQTVSSEEIETLAARPENRLALFDLLRELKRSDLFPSKYKTSVAQGEAALAYWMMHPNELQDAPESIELVETITRPIEGHDSDFHVFRYKMAEGHWAAKNGWILGLAGPLQRGIEAYSVMPGAFSRVSDTEGKVKPSELVDWYIDVLRQKGMIK